MAVSASGASAGVEDVNMPAARHAIVSPSPGVDGAIEWGDAKNRLFGMALNEGAKRVGFDAILSRWRIELEGSILSSGGAGFELLTAQPLWESEGGNDLILLQLSWNRMNDHKSYADGDVIAAGMAWRRLTQDRSIAYGLNLFADHALEKNHNRISVGADAQGSMFGLIANHYIPLSDWKTLDDFTEEKASSGVDLELQGRHPSLPSWQVNLRGYWWSGGADMGGGDIYGYDVGLQWQPVNALVWETSFRDEQKMSAEVRSSIRLMYRFGDRLEDLWRRPVTLTDASERMYNKVSRENAMRTSRRLKEAALAAGNTLLCGAAQLAALALGQQCDGIVYAGMSPDGNERMYTTTANEAPLSFNDGVWGNWVVTGTVDPDTGRANTATIVATDSSIAPGIQEHAAAQRCVGLSIGGYTDWYLPARNEMQILWNNRAAIGGFPSIDSWPDTHYVTSTEDNASQYIVFNSFWNNFYLAEKQNPGAVRCVRRDG